MEDYWKGLALELKALEYSPVGSMYILGSGQDDDCMILVRNIREAWEYLVSDGWETETYIGQNDVECISFRMGNRNALVTEIDEFYQNFLSAAEVCKYLWDTFEFEPIMERDVRVAIHQMILYNKKASAL